MLVVRARSTELFDEPELHPVPTCSHPTGYHSFGWIDGVSVNPQIGNEGGGNSVSPVEPLSILLRTESDNPWSVDTHTLDLYTLQSYASRTDDVSTSDDVSGPRPSTASGLTPAYVFPPTRSTLSAPSVRGFLRCNDIVLGSFGTAVWIQPRSVWDMDLTTLDVHASETQGSERQRTSDSLAAAVFEGPLHRRHPSLGLSARTLWADDDFGGNWTALDYEEVHGRVAMGSTHGTVSVLQLG